VDKLGLVPDNAYLVVEIPALNSVIPFRVVTRLNHGYEVINYGLVPLTSGTSLPTLDGGTATVPEDGVLPAMAYVPNSSPIKFPASNLVSSGVSDLDDMFYISRKDYPDRVLHVKAYFTPSWVRVVVDMPENTLQAVYQSASLDIYRDFGFARGEYEVVFLPDIRAGWRFANDTNMDVYLFVKFVYGEYKIEVVTDPVTVFNLVVGKQRAHWVTLPVNSVAYGLTEALRKTYGFEGYPLYPEHKREEAISIYTTLAEEVKRTMGEVGKKEVR